MMKALFIFTLLSILCLNLAAQENLEPILRLIEQNNKTLTTLRAETEATITGNHTGLFPDNPEAEYSHLWGTPSAVGNRKDFSVLQSFDFPLAYRYRSQIASMRDELAEADYDVKRFELFFHTRRILAELNYLNALREEYRIRLEHAEKIVSVYQQRFDAGDANVLDLNKAEVNRLSFVQKIERVQVEREYLLTELKMLNGGEFIEYDVAEMEIPELSSDFQIYMTVTPKNNPFLQRSEQEARIAGKQVQLNRALSMPEIRAGYMSEKVVGEHFQGITAGISIPLWENKNKVKHARVYADAVSLKAVDLRFRFYSEMENAYNKALSLQQIAVDFEKNLAAVDNQSLLDKALDAGQISLSEYLLEVSVYFKSIDELLELKRDALTAYYDLFRYGMNE